MNSIVKTEGIKYAGSKLKLLPHILQLASTVPHEAVFDGFAGTTRVSQAFARLGSTVIMNDIAVWSKVFGQCYLQAEKEKKFYQNIIAHLNALPGKDGWFTEHYGGEPNGGSAVQQDGCKKPWQTHNTRKLDAIRDEIDSLDASEIDKSVLITSLIHAMDDVDSTLGHYAAYLQQWSPRSYNTMKMQVPEIIKSQKKHTVYNGDIFDVVTLVDVDLAYYDPPYGSNNDKMPPSRVRYASYYHLWTTICLNDKPQLFGKVNRRKDTSDIIAGSVFEDFRCGESGKFIVVEAIEKLLERTTAKFIILSYSSGGRATAEELMDVIQRYGKIKKLVKVDYRKNVMAEMKWTNEWIREVETSNQEFLFLIERI
ncbi:MAG: DNA methyltransferase [Bacteroidetes bacterium]|nr:MAG: DNA methyltransferase [Bacteroidota bacterium]